MESMKGGLVRLRALMDDLTHRNGRSELIFSITRKKPFSPRRHSCPNAAGQPGGDYSSLQIAWGSGFSGTEAQDCGRFADR